MVQMATGLPFSYELDPLSSWSGYFPRQLDKIFGPSPLKAAYLQSQEPAPLQIARRVVAVYSIPQSHPHGAASATGLWKSIQI